MFISGPPSHLGVSAVVVLKISWLEHLRLRFIVILAYYRFWHNLLWFCGQYLWCLQWIFFTILPETIISLLFGWSFL